MRAQGLLKTFLAFLLLFTTISAAWPDRDGSGRLVRRQDEETTSTGEPTSTEESSTTTTDDNSSTASATETDSNSDSNSNSDSDKSTTSGTITASRSGETDEPSSTRNENRTTAIDPRLPPGGVAMITPAQIEGPQYYKVGDFVTFEWNYTSLSVTPSAIDVIASCSLNSATYTIASNMSVEETGRIIWDTGESATATNPFPVASYTLYIHDSSKDIGDTPQAGYLGSFNGLQFGMYTPQPYVPLNQFRCATCNGGLSAHERQALGVIFLTTILTVVSFTWFANGFGAFS